MGETKKLHILIQESWEFKENGQITRTKSEQVDMWLVPVFPAIIMIRAGQNKRGAGIIENRGLLLTK